MVFVTDFVIRSVEHSCHAIKLQLLAEFNFSPNIGRACSECLIRVCIQIMDGRVQV